MKNKFEKDINEKKEEMFKILESIGIGDLENKGFNISFAGKTFRFSDVEIIDDGNIEKIVREEYKGKLNQQQQNIREKLNNKINQLLLIHQTKQHELDKKEDDLKRKYSQAAMMPDINEQHACKGLSVVKGSSNDEICWIYRGIYNPRFIIYKDDAIGRKVKKPLPKRLLTRMKQNILICIYTKGNNVIRVSTKNMINSNKRTLTSFSHYHQTGSDDCWGNWKHDRSYKTINDILKIAKDAEAVLEVINNGSIAKRGPNGLPRISTILKNVEKTKPESKATTNEIFEEDQDIWQAA